MHNHTWQYPILATGAALPAKCWSNAELVGLLAARGVETSSEWIESRTGITQRYWCAGDENVMTLARDAVAQALTRAQANLQDVAVLVVATCTPNLNFPSVAAQVHGELGLPGTCMALDVNAACNGFVQALGVARGLLATLPAGGVSRPLAVVVGAEQFSKLLNLDDRSTCVLFGDGAGAVVMGCEPAEETPRGVLTVTGGSAGRYGPALTTAPAGMIQMDGREIFKQAVRQMGGNGSDSLARALATAQITLAQIDHVVPHQANRRILESAATALGVDPAKVVVTVDQHANTSAASIPLALNVAVEAGKLKRDEIVLLQAFGAGVVWGEAVIRW